jgi:quercetin dioxygenase-like cupin family protein
MASVFAVSDLQRSPTAALFQGGDEIPVSMFVTEYPNGRGPDLHTHPYAEMFLVEKGEATFTAGDEEVVVPAGNILVVPPETVHGFKNRGDEQLRVVSVHPSPQVVQTDL